MSSAITIAPSVNIYASRQPQLYAPVITTYTPRVTAVSIRLWARELMKTIIVLDDWSVVLALVRLYDECKLSSSARTDVSDS